MNTQRIGPILNADVIGVMANDRYCLRVAYTDRTVALACAGFWLTVLVGQ